MKKVRAIAFVLPQFHPIPENDLWWGKGFTEWTNVGKAKPLFDGHYQPKLPTDLGYYDLRLPEARQAQAQIAQDHGISGFCYYHYWFNGQRLLNQPIDQILRLNEPSMPFMLCWANENWTRRWDGLDQEILIKQDYSQQDDKNHMRWLCEHVFADERYIKVDGCPVFMVYRQDLFPDIAQTAQTWRRIAQEEFGYKDLYLCVTESFNKKVDAQAINFDASVEFSPHVVIKHPLKKMPSKGLFSKKQPDVNYRDFKKGVKECLARDVIGQKLYRCVTPSWDNSARKGLNGYVAMGSSPEVYQEWLRATVHKFEPYSEQENFVFINAMNEWAEGNYLEPCQKFGRAYLEATKTALTPYL